MRLFFAAAIALACAGAAQAQTIEETLLDALTAKGAPGDAAVSIVGTLPAGLDPDTLTVASVDYDAASGRFSAKMKLATGRVIGLQGKVESGADVPVLNRPMRVGEVVASEDVSYLRLASSRIPRGTIGAADELIGLSAKRQLRPNVALRDSDFEKPVVVRKGDAVVMVFRAEGIELTTRGKAMTNGGVGETVAVVNTQSLKQVDAVVTGAGAVSVSPQGLVLN